jgi:HAD superfamily hydrolase (TIGR01509 family)
MPFSAIFFDCDGVLIDSEILYARVGVQHQKEVFGIEEDTASYNRRYCGLGVEPFLKAFRERVQRPLPEGFAEEMVRRQREAFRTQLERVAYVKEVIEQLNLPSCVASNTPLETLRLCLTQTGLYDLFAPHIYSAQMVAHGKPAPDLFLLAAEKMGADPSECLVIEDGPYGVTAAKAAGMRVFGFTGGSHCYPGYATERLSETELVFSDFRELPALLCA